MTDKELSALINVLRCANKITALQKDILDTFDALQKNPFDKKSAQKQILSNNINHPDVFIAISAMVFCCLFWDFSNSSEKRVMPQI